MSFYVTDTDTDTLRLIKNGQTSWVKNYTACAIIGSTTSGIWVDATTASPGRRVRFIEEDGTEHIESSGATPLAAVNYTITTNGYLWWRDTTAGTQIKGVAPTTPDMSSPDVTINPAVLSLRRSIL